MNGKNRPTAIIITNCAWKSTAQFIKEISIYNLDLIFASPKNHPARNFAKFSATFDICPSSPESDITNAIKAGRPDFIIVIDDNAAQHIYNIFSQTTDRVLKDLIAHSLGDPQWFPFLHNRQMMNDLAASQGIPTPPTIPVKNSTEVKRALAAIGLPAFLKMDGSASGDGVINITKSGQAKNSWNSLNRSILHYPKALAKTFIKTRKILPVPSVTQNFKNRFCIQKSIEGELVTFSAFCWKGKILSWAMGRILQHQYDLGPASLIQIEHDGQLVSHAQALLSKLGLNGFCGFDFIRNAAGTYYFIEFNPRLTPLSRISTSDGGDAMAAFVGAAFNMSAQRRAEAAQCGSLVQM